MSQLINPEFEPRPETPEITAEYAETFMDVNPSKTYPLVCADDRHATQGSVEALRAPGLESVDTSFRYYGGMIGLAEVLAVTMAIQHKGIFDGTDGDFISFTQDLLTDIQTKTPQIVPMLHSAEANEGNADHIDHDSEKGLGCAYAAGVAVVNGLAQDEAIIALAHKERPLQKPSLDAISEASADVAAHFKLAGVTREDYRTLGVPVEILEGSHASADDAIAVVNYNVGRISRPKLANQSGIPFYSNDVTKVAETLMLAKPELQLDPVILLAVMDQNIRATREALASSEGKHAEALELQQYGTPDDAVAYLRSLKQAA